MTATKPAPPAYRSGWCSSGYHERCRGAYGNVVCDCEHHGQAEPEVLEQPAPPDPAALFATVTHSAGVASVGYAGKLAQAVCSCGWAAPDPRVRNHDAFDDARTHLAAAAEAVPA